MKKIILIIIIPMIIIMVGCMNAHAYEIEVDFDVVIWWDSLTGCYPWEENDWSILKKQKTIGLFITNQDELNELKESLPALNANSSPKIESGYGFIVVSFYVTTNLGYDLSLSISHDKTFILILDNINSGSSPDAAHRVFMVLSVKIDSKLSENVVLIADHNGNKHEIDSRVRIPIPIFFMDYWDKNI